jgi:hypothetical protein
MGLLRAGRISVFPDTAITLQAIAPLDRREERPRSGLGYAEGAQASSRKVVAGFREGTMRNEIARAKAAQAAAGA